MQTNLFQGNVCLYCNSVPQLVINVVSWDPRLYKVGFHVSKHKKENNYLAKFKLKVKNKIKTVIFSRSFCGDPPEHVGGSAEVGQDSARTQPGHGLLHLSQRRLPVKETLSRDESSRKGLWNKINTFRVRICVDFWQAYFCDFLSEKLYFSEIT